MQFSNAGSGLRYHTDFNNAGEIRLDSAGSAATDERYVLSEYSIITISGSTVTPIGSPTTTRDATAEEIAEVIHAVIVKRVAIECRFTMLQDDIISSLCQLVIAVIVSIVADKAKGVALFHPDMSESLKTIGLLIEMRTVTVEVGTGMAEMNITMQHLGIIILELAVMQVVRVNQIDTFVLHLFPRRALTCRRDSKS